MSAAKEIVEYSKLKVLILDQGHDVDERICPCLLYTSDAADE